MRRTLTTGLVSLVLLAPPAISGWLGCHAIAGIEDRTYVPPEEQEPEPDPVRIPSGGTLCSSTG